MSHKIGDIVTLKSGSPAMTVVAETHMGPMSPTDITVVWVDDKQKVQRTDFPEVCLIPMHVPGAESA